MACIDLFCGVGGLSHGLMRSGINVVAGVDVDPACRFPYEENNGRAVFLHRDIGILTGDDLAKFYPEGSPRILAGCAPCQPFSSYSQGRDARKDGKWGLLNHFGRLVEESQPHIVTMENVPQLPRHEVLVDFLGTLKRLNYRVSYGVLKCALFGVPQRRERFVLLASRLGEIELPKSNSNQIATVREAIGCLTKISAGESDPEDRLHAASWLSPLNKKRIRHSSPGGSWRDWPDQLVAACHKKQSGKTYPSVYGRMEWDKPAPTITTLCYGYGNGRFGHPEQDRAISLREASILQSFPLNYQFVEKDAPVEFRTIGRLIGNAVRPLLAKGIGTAIVKHLSEHGYH